MHLSQLLTVGKHPMWELLETLQHQRRTELTSASWRASNPSFLHLDTSLWKTYNLISLGSWNLELHLAENRQQVHIRKRWMDKWCDYFRQSVRKTNYMQLLWNKELSRRNQANETLYAQWYICPYGQQNSAPLSWEPSTAAFTLWEEWCSFHCTPLTIQTVHKKN